MFNLKTLELQSNLFSAPLAGYSDFAFRQLCFEFGAGLTFTEMVSAKGLCYGSKNTAELLFNHNIPTAVQLFGCDPKFIAEAVSHPLLSRFDVVDINMGCPVRKIVCNGEGSALINTPKLAYEVVKAIKLNCGKRLVSVKTRIGFEMEKPTAVDFCKVLEDAGADFITVHGRYAKQMYAGTCNYGEIAKAKNAVKIPVIASGDIKDCESLKLAKTITGADGFMVGRGAIGKPHIFAELMGEDALNINAKQLLLKQIELLKENFSDDYICRNFKKQICFYVKGSKNAVKIKQTVCRQLDMGQLVNCINELL